MLLLNFHSEDANHLLFNCNFSKDVFAYLNDCVGWCCLPVMHYSHNLIDNLNNIKAALLDEKLVRVCIVWWLIWFRCNRVFSKRSTLWWEVWLVPLLTLSMIGLRLSKKCWGWFSGVLFAVFALGAEWGVIVFSSSFMV